jgi:hypothetical protein
MLADYRNESIRDLLQRMETISGFKSAFEATYAYIALYVRYYIADLMVSRLKQSLIHPLLEHYGTYGTIEEYCGMDTVQEIIAFRFKQCDDKPPTLSESTSDDVFELVHDLLFDWMFDDAYRESVCIMKEHISDHLGWVIGDNLVPSLFRD